MKKIRLLPFILALSLPLSGCDLFSKSSSESSGNENEPGQQQTEKTLTGISAVHAPETIGKGETLSESLVDLDLTYSDSSTASVKAEKVTLDTSSIGTKTGTAFYGQFFKDFTIEVVEKSSGQEDEEKSFTKLKDDILTNHNYTLDTVSYYKNYPSRRYEGYMYNISDKAYYGKDPEYENVWDSGLIKVKDQGVASFYMSLLTQEVTIQNFVSSNPERGIYNISPLLVEYLLEGELTKIDDDHYTCANQDLIGMMANFSGLELAYISNPHHLDIYRIDDTLKVEFTLSANYYDDESLEPIEDEPVYMSVLIKNIGSTHNSVIESFVEDPSKKLPTPTIWNAEALSDFGEYYDDYIPPFPSGASYAFSEFAEWVGLEQKHIIYCQDLASGDLRSSYASQLEGQDFTLENGIYRKRVVNSAGTLESVYEAKMTFYAPSAPYSGFTYGYFFPNGVFQVEFSMYTHIIEAVTNIESLNTYVASTAAAGIAPVFPEEYNSTSITGFDDHTKTINDLYPNSVLFATSSTGLFKIHISDYASALAFYSELMTRAAAKGFTDVSSFNGLTNALDAAGSKIAITDMTSKTSSSYEGYLQCQIYIRNNYTEYYSVTLNKDDGVSSALITSPSNYMKVQEGQKVTFTLSIAEGYELDEITSSVEGVELTKESEGVYSFNMPAHNITINIKTRSKAAEEGLVYDKEYLVYVGRTSGNQFYERPTIEGSTKLSFVFGSDGTGTFTYIWFNSAGNTNAGPYTVEFTYTLISGSFMIVCTSGGDNALFGNFRLFTSGTEGNYNETGTFNNNEITITLSNGSGSAREVTLK